MKIGVITIFPSMFDALANGVVGKAIANNLVSLKLFNPIDYLSYDKRIDDKSYGGGPGMVMRYEPLKQALEHAISDFGVNSDIIYLSPHGKKITQNILENCVAKNNPQIYLCGRYEGVDQRVIDRYVTDEWSLGDFVMTGGEYAAMSFIDAIIRLIPGCVGDPDSVLQDSFSSELLDYPHYTRPKCIDGLSVPDVLLSGDHEKIYLWRKQQALGLTWLKRPDLLKKSNLSQEDLDLLVGFKRSYGKLDKL